VIMSTSPFPAQVLIIAVMADILIRVEDETIRPAIETTGEDVLHSRSVASSRQIILSGLRQITPGFPHSKVLSKTHSRAHRLADNNRTRQSVRTLISKDDPIIVRKGLIRQRM